MTTTVIVGKAEQATKDELSFRRWPSSARTQVLGLVDIAYFDESEKDGGEEMPQYRISFKLAENGLTRDLMMDYGGFFDDRQAGQFAPVRPSAAKKLANSVIVPVADGGLCRCGNLELGR